MTVRIPITADAAGVSNAFEQIRTAIRRAGQEGRAFKDLDLSHPELKRVADDLLKLQENFEKLSKIGRGSTAAAVRGGGFSDAIDWYQRHGAAFPDERDRQRHTSQAGRYILQGTQFAPLVPQTPHAGPQEEPGRGGGGGGGGSSGGGGNGFASMLSLGKTALPWMLGLAGIQKAGAALSTAVSGANNEDVSTDVLARHLRDTGSDFDALRLQVRKTTEGLQLNIEESHRLSLAWAQLTNETHGARVTDQVRFATGMARGYGLDPGAMVSTLGRASFLGEDPKRFAGMIGDAVREGGQSGQVEQTMQALLRWSEGASRHLVTRTDVDGFASMYSGLNATGMPGLKGAAAEALISQINGSVMKGGAFGDASLHATYRAFARHGLTDPYQIDYLLAGGMFDSQKKAFGRGDGATTFEVMREEINRQYAGQSDYRRWMAMANHFGINARQAESLDKFHYGDIGLTQSWLARSGVSLSGVNPTALNDISEVIGSNADLGAWRERIMRRKDVSGDAKGRLSGLDGDSLREELVRVLGEFGMEKSDGTKMLEGQARMAEEMTKIASALTPALSDIRMAVVGILGVFSGGAEMTRDAYRAIMGDKAAADRVNTSWAKRREEVGREQGWLPPDAQRAVPPVPSVSPAPGALPVTPPVLPSEGVPRVSALPKPPLPDTDVDARKAFLSALEGVESANGTRMKASGSSAYGWHQFTEGTWMDTIRRFGGDRTAGLGRDEILALRGDREFSRLMASYHLNRDLAPALEKEGVPVTPLSLYAGWHFGVGGKNHTNVAAAIMKAPDNALMESLVSPAAMKANPYLEGMTAGQWRKIFGNRFEKAGALQPGTPLPPSDPRQRQQTGMDFNIQPLRVVHETPDGQMISTEQLPITTVGRPIPWGIG